VTSTSGFFQAGSDIVQQDREELLANGQSATMSFRVQGEQLLAESQILEDEMLAGTGCRDSSR
jgi:hypothetical protein